jgi:integrase
VVSNQFRAIAQKFFFLRVLDNLVDLRHRGPTLLFEGSRRGIRPLASTMLPQAAAIEIWNTNPRKHIKKYPEEKRERFLSAAELRRVGEVLREMEEEGIEISSGIAAVRLLILTGCRLGEIMRLKWDYVDFESRALRLPDSKTGAKTVHLGLPAFDVLTAIAQVIDNPWVITGTLPGAPLYDLQPFWQRVRARAGLKDVRIHDLRHTFASTAVAAGQGLPMIGKLLGHTQVQTTARYAHLAVDPVRSAADLVSSAIAALLQTA